MTTGTPLVDILLNGSVSFRNRLINGEMVLDQRNAGAALTPGSTGTTYSVDRWALKCSQASKITVQQNGGALSLPTASLQNYLRGITASAYTPLSTDYFSIGQAIEGYNVRDLQWGTANAKAVTLRFWALANNAGTYSGAIVNSAGNRGYPFTYTLAANTWTEVVITIPGDTSGTWLTTSGIGLLLRFSLGSGSNFLGTAGAWGAGDYHGATGELKAVLTSGAYLCITGVQLERGTAASNFEHRPWGLEYVLCQRYCQVHPSMIMGGYNAAAGTVVTPFMLPVPMRPGSPTATLSGQSYTNGSGLASNAASNNEMWAGTLTVTATGYASCTFALKLENEL